MQSEIGERKSLARLVARLDTPPDPHDMVRLQKTIKEYERKIQELEG